MKPLHLLTTRPKAHRTIRPFRTLVFGAVICAALGTAPSLAQETETATALLADSVTFDGTQLIASGSVEVFYGETRLKATRIVYDRTTGALIIEGPLELASASGNTVILASSAEIDDEFRNGLLTSARLVIDRQMQLAAARLDLVEGRYLRLEKTVSSTCEVCADNPVPLWEIRASEVIHDSVERQIYFTNAHLRVAGVPVLWLPKLRVPDPTLDRATGFLIPSIRSDSNLGIGIEIPYFITLGDDKDLTVTPYIASKTTTLGLRYRQAFTNGQIALTGAVSRDDTYDSTRAYIFAEGQWDVGQDFDLGINLRATSNIAYLADYGIFEEDYLPSSITLTRFKEDEAFDAELIYLRNLRDTNATITDIQPSFVGDFRYEHLYSPERLPGRLTFGLTASTSYRQSDADADGYDVLRLGAESRWDANTIFGPGLRLDGSAAIYADSYVIDQYAAYDSSVLRLTGEAETRLGWPLKRQTASGASQLLEPIVQVGWSRTTGGDIPNDDSNFVEFDEGNLLSLSKFPGADRRETGLTSAAGLRFSHYGERAQYAFTLGRVMYLEETGSYSNASGLSETQSDWLLAAGVEFGSGLSLNSRALLTNDAEATKWETRLSLIRPRYEIGTTYNYVVADALEDRTSSLNELGFDGTFKLTDDWSAETEYLFDLTSDEATRAGLTLTYQNECARVSLGIERRFWDTSTLDPTTRFSFSVGFGSYGSSTASKNSCAI
ncbi:LPS-assembly protein LptD [Celeribacter litoreus]|uniref:LPS-assembly protein LptD n=1 Tax=Celeribacter litoreus TaxID=2876714 RepID=UPI001CC92FF8|nr:LPS assembly protein LptD [Celeribacter litoreus]MCA0043702.1 LPS assembly protein LptD [Celeribacter litoreus]